MADPREQYLPGELESLLALGAGPDLPPEVIEQMLVERGVRSPRRAPRDPGPLIPLDTPLADLVRGLYENAEDAALVPGPPGAPPMAPYYEVPSAPAPVSPPSGSLRAEGLRGAPQGAPPAPSPGAAPPSEPWLQQFITPASPQAMLGGINRMMAQGTPGSAMPGDMAQTGGFNMPPGPVEPPMKPGGFGMDAIRQRMMLEAARQGQQGAGAPPPGLAGVAGAAGAPVPGAPPQPLDPIAKGAQAAQQAAAAGSAAQAQSAPADPYAHLPPALAAALREYSAISADLKKQDESAKWMALAKAGFAMAGSNKGFLGALGDGGMAGLSAYEQAMQADAANRMRAAGMDLDVAKMTTGWEADQAAALRQAEKDELDRQYTLARIGSLNRSGRGAAGGAGAQNGITQAQYLSQLRAEEDAIRNSGPAAMRLTPAEVTKMATESLNAKLAAAGFTVRGTNLPGGSAAAATAGLGAVADLIPGETVEDGMLYVGGDPGKPESWEPVDE